MASEITERTTLKQPKHIEPTKGKLGVLLVGMGAVSTTTIAGTMLSRKGAGTPVGSLTQMGSIRLGKRTDKRSPLIKDLVPLASMDDIVFGGWDIFPDNAYEAAKRAGVLNNEHLAVVKSELETVQPMKGVFYQEYLPRLRGVHIFEGQSKLEAVEKIRQDIRDFKSKTGVDRVVVVWAASTETYLAASDVHKDIGSFEAGLKRNDPGISPTQIYAWACMKEGVPFANGAPNLGVDFAAAFDLAKETQTPIAGKDFKTGQTLIKTVLAPMPQGADARSLNGWYSTNILGNRDGEVLDDADSFHVEGSHQARRPRRKSSSRSRTTRRSTARSPTRFASTTTRRAATKKRAGTTSICSVGSTTRCR